MPDDIFAEGFSTDPYWWDAAPRPRLEPRPLPPRCDLVVVGSGFTGLSAALTAARGGRETIVLEAEVPGYGASTRNAGYVGRTLFHKFEPLIAKVGPERAARMQGEAVRAHHYLVELIAREQIECGFVYCGRFIGASTRRHFDLLARDIEMAREHGNRARSGARAQVRAGERGAHGLLPGRPAAPRNRRPAPRPLPTRPDGTGGQRRRAASSATRS